MLCPLRLQQTPGRNSPQDHLSVVGQNWSTFEEVVRKRCFSFWTIGAIVVSDRIWPVAGSNVQFQLHRCFLNALPSPLHTQSHHPVPARKFSRFQSRNTPVAVHEYSSTSIGRSTFRMVRPLPPRHIQSLYLLIPSPTSASPYASVSEVSVLQDFKFDQRHQATFTFDPHVALFRHYSVIADCLCRRTSHPRRVGWHNERLLVAQPGEVSFPQSGV